MEIFLFTDWACRGNPWESWWGWIAYTKDKQVLFTWKKYFWQKTNNQSEYLALIEWIIESLEHKPTQLNIFMDSELIVNQLNKKYKVRNKDLKELFIEVEKLLQNTKTSFKHVRRHLNKDADRLANESLDEY